MNDYDKASAEPQSLRDTWRDLPPPSKESHRSERPHSPHWETVREIIRLFALHYPWKLLLQRLVRTVEQFDPEVNCAVHLFSRRTERLHLAAAENLSGEFKRGLICLDIGPAPGNERELAELRWDLIEDLATRHGRHTRRLEPLVDHNGSLLGAFVLFGRHTVQDGMASDDFVDCCRHLAQLILSFRQRERRLAAARQRIDSLMEHEKTISQVPGLAHDINNLLCIIGGYASILLEDLPAQHPRYEDIVEIHRAARQGECLTRQVLQRKPLTDKETVPIDLNDTVSNCVGMLRKVLGTGVELQLQLAPLPMRIRVDPLQIERILMNLAINARDAMPDGGTLKISTARVHLGASSRLDNLPAGRYVSLTVRDSGSGMSKRIMEHVFEAYFTTKGSGQGTGLGLATVQDIVRSHRGTVTFDSREGGGTRFDIYLPEASDSSNDASAERA
jgi:signal transduction histidine kinase